MIQTQTGHAAGYCRKCEVKLANNGECPKRRFIQTSSGEDGLNYLCVAYKRFFNHIDLHMKTMAQFLRAWQPPAAIMRMPATGQFRQQLATAGRNYPCPCGSEKKFKKCCGALNKV